MKLVNKETNQPLVEFSDQETIFYNKFLENEMRQMGIAIPHGMRSSYHGQECVRLDDLDFQRAFREVYYLTAMSPDTFYWSE